MNSLNIDPADSRPLIEQIVTGIKQRVDERALRPGTRLPSIRDFAEQHRVSKFTVVQAFDRLVAMGYLKSRQGSGFYVPPRQESGAATSQSCQLNRAMDVLWLLRNALQEQPHIAMPAAGWLPGEWMDGAGIQRSLRTLARKSGTYLTGYGLPAGYEPLRSLLARRLEDQGIACAPRQIVTTRGATHALDLIARLFVKPGDAVLVDDPGYYTLFGYLKLSGARLVGVPWTPSGPDTAVLENQILEHQPKIFFTNTLLHNPTGVSISQSVAHRVLQLAERHDLLIVEDDIYGDLLTGRATRLATLDQLERVVFVSSFSKTVSASLRVGFLACKYAIAESLTDLKLLTSLTTSEIDERLVYELLTDGYYRKHLEKLRSRLQKARAEAVRNLERSGLEIYQETEDGLFIWARREASGNATALAGAAAKQGIMLAPGALFRPHQEASPWLRFNAAGCENPAIFRFLESVRVDDNL
ncbi:PLP-dependent aminotransferase family protein [Methyloterricola oryzae]|uniref:aminotransferase-like domain-containing protein n=1 Tax=Methyloterricola oryzae TaxID=1495050 RepID=UPI0005EB49CE|nr:PLP-dependent aminotransferase family protein [Methyloterricola oryzae]